MENIRIETKLRRVDGVSIIDASGEVDIYTTPQLKQSINAAIDEGHSTVVINMSQVNYMDSSGFGALLSATKRLRPINGSLSLFGCNDAIRRMLQITRLNTIFGVFDTEEEAIGALMPVAGPSIPARNSQADVVAMAS